MRTSEHTPLQLGFSVDVVDGWPPVGVEFLRCTKFGEGIVRVDVPPLYIKGISCGDMLRVNLVSENQVGAWNHEFRSNHSTIWFLRIGAPDNIPEVLSKLRKLGCHTVELADLGSYSIDVPPECPIREVDECIEGLDSTKVVVAYPSFRHDDVESGLPKNVDP